MPARVAGHTQGVRSRAGPPKLLSACGGGASGRPWRSGASSRPACSGPLGVLGARRRTEDGGGVQAPLPRQQATLASLHPDKRNAAAPYTDTHPSWTCPRPRRPGTSGRRRRAARWRPPSRSRRWAAAPAAAARRPRPCASGWPGLQSRRSRGWGWVQRGACVVVLAVCLAVCVATGGRLLAE